MALSEAARHALQARAAGLQAEISSLKVRRDEALTEASEAQRDAALMAEVTRLEGVRDDLAEQKAQADGSVESALALMNTVAEVHEATSADPVEEAVVEASEDAPLLGAMIDTETKEG